MIAILWACAMTALIYAMALVRRDKKKWCHLCACGCGVEIKVGRTLHDAACRKRMQRRRDRIKRGLPPEPPPKLPLFPKLGYSTAQEEMPFTGKINDWSGGHTIHDENGN